MPYDPRQPRDWHGRWSDIDGDEGEGGVQDVRDIFPVPLDDKDPDCREEWVYASQFCTALMIARKLRRGSGFGRDWEKCVYGMVSERCGGNKVDHDKSPKKPDAPRTPGGKR